MTHEIAHFSPINSAREPMTLMMESERNAPTVNNEFVFKTILITLLSIQTALLIYLSWQASPNRTEAGHIGAAVYLWHTGKFDVFHVNPPLTRAFAGMPVALFCNPNYDWKSYSPRPQDRCEWALGSAFINANDFDDLRWYVFLMRLACIPFVLLGGYFGFRFAAELYGKWSGITFLVLWTFSPLILGWGATICPDVAGASVGIIGLYTFWQWLKNPRWGKAIVAGICLGLMPLTKMTWIIAFPIWCLIFIIWKFWKNQDEIRLSWKQLAALLFTAFYVINSGYLYDGSFKLLKDYKFISGTLTGTEITKNRQTKQGNRFADSWLGSIPVPLPAEFVQGIDTQKLDFERGIESYANGVWSERGWWWYYCYVLLFKEPLGVFGLTILALLTSCCFRKNNVMRRDELTVLIPLLLVFVFLSSQTGLSIHARYILPVLPLFYIFISKVASSPFAVCRLLSLIFLVWIVGSSLWCYPYSMSYFNELAGKPKNYPRYLLGSNIDWGQDAYALKTWIEKHSEVKPIYISYSSSVPMEKLGIENTERIPNEPTSGWMVVGVNDLFTKEGNMAWLKQHEPVCMVGYSIYIYHITQE